MIYFDIDGVLNSHQHCKRRKQFIPRIEREPARWFYELIERSNHDLFLISSWKSVIHRGVCTIKGFEWMLKTHGIQNANVVGCHPPAVKGLGPIEDRRQHLLDIKEPHVIIDDLNLRLPNHVIPNTKYGFTKEDMKKSLHILRLQEDKMKLNRHAIINHLIKKHGYKSYLEIGVAYGMSFKPVKAVRKIGVDPNSSVATHKMTSNKFFSQNKENFDIIFIDGLHVSGQVAIDVKNSLKFLNDGGSIVLHDCNPPKEINQMVPRPMDVAWTGDVWKSIVELRCTEPKLNICVVDCDWGCGVIQRGSQTIYKKENIKECLKWSYFKNNRKELLNLISSSEFLESNF